MSFTALVHLAQRPKRHQHLQRQRLQPGGMILQTMNLKHCSMSFMEKVNSVVKRQPSRQNPQRNNLLHQQVQTTKYLMMSLKHC